MSNFMKVVINNIETSYRIYEDGRCYNEKTKKWLKPKTSLKYDRYSLSVNGKVKDFYIHRLVAEYFVPNPELKKEVNHIDGNTKNNNKNNLEWCSRQENLLHQKENYLYHKKKIKQYDLNGNFINSWNTASQIKKELNISQSSIINCCNNKQENSGGFQWCYEGNESNIKVLKLNTKLRNQTILMLDFNNNIIKEFEKVSDVYKYFNKTDNGYISQVLKGKRKSAWGYKFQYKNI